MNVPPREADKFKMGCFYGKLPNRPGKYIADFFAKSRGKICNIKSTIIFFDRNLTPIPPAFGQLCCIFHPIWVKNGKNILKYNFLSRKLPSPVWKSSKKTFHYEFVGFPNLNVLSVL